MVKMARWAPSGATGPGQSRTVQRAGRVVWKEMGRDVWETLIYQILLEVSLTAAPKSPQVMSEALYPIAKCFKFLPGHESQSAFSCLEEDGRKWVFEILHFEALMEKFHKENR